MLQADRDAFDAFVRARLPHLLRLGRALTGSEQAGADLVQDALERSLMRWSRIESEDPEGYVRRVMVTRNISAWRRVRRERLTAEVPQTSYDDAPPDSPVDATDVLADVHRGVRNRQQRRLAVGAAGVLAVLTASGVLTGTTTGPDRSRDPATGPTSAPSGTSATTRPPTPGSPP